MHSTYLRFKHGAIKANIMDNHLLMNTTTTTMPLIKSTYTRGEKLMLLIFMEGLYSIHLFISFIIVHYVELMYSITNTQTPHGECIFG